LENARSLTPDEVAAILNITKQTVYDMIKRNELPAYRIGRKLRIDPRDVDLYRSQGKNFELPSSGPRIQEIPTALPPAASFAAGPATDKLVVCGQDIVLDLLARQLEKKFKPLRVFRYQVGSFDGLSALYHGQADMAAIHLWDGDSGQYNVPYVRHLLPGVPVVIVHLAQRMQGFYVRQGNPKQVKGWSDLKRTDLTIVNREKGSGTRVLLDERLRLLGADRSLLPGYHREEYSHLAVASAVARGEADLALGNEKGAMQVRGIEFIPLQRERYELVIAKTEREELRWQAVLEILQSDSFKSELLGLGDYDVSETGQIIAEL